MAEDKESLLKRIAEFGQLQEESNKKYDGECDAFWESLSYNDKLKAFHSVIKRVHKGDVEDRGSYRHVLYSIFGFSGEAYGLGMDCGYMAIHNYISSGIDAEAKEVEDRIGRLSGKEQKESMASSAGTEKESQSSEEIT